MLEHAMSAAENTLTYDNQLDFIKWVEQEGDIGLGKGFFYFDFITPVDATKVEQPDIDGFYADGSVTWGQALEALKDHYK